LGFLTDILVGFGGAVFNLGELNLRRRDLVKFILYLNLIFELDLLLYIERE